MKTPFRTLAVLLPALLSACAGQASEELFIHPGRFDHYDCDGIAKAQVSAANRERQYAGLIERAGKETVGVWVAEASYRGDYLRAKGEQKMLAEVAQRKNCTAETPSPAVPHPPKH